MSLSAELPPLSARARTLRVALLVGVGVLGGGLLFLLRGPMPQPLDYHDFADQRQLLGVPHALNVLSNAPFLIVGVLGLAFVVRDSPQRHKAFIQAAERWPYVIFFIGVTLTAFGSAYYHLDPVHAGNERLVWDRLPMGLAFMALFDAVLGERLSVRAGRWLLAPLLAAGLGSVLYWHVTEMQGHGDLRPYYLVQFYPVLAIPLMLLLFPPRYTRGQDLIVAVAWYAGAKLFEMLDRPVYELLGHAVSGHTIKHLLAATSAYWVLRMLQARSPAGRG
jgi:hypothetical protein